MAKTATTKNVPAPKTTDDAAEPKTRRPRRSPADKIAALEAEIEKTRAREAAKAAKARPEVQALLAAIKSIDRATEAAAEAGDRALQRQLATACAALKEKATEMGLRVPQRRSEPAS